MSKQSENLTGLGSNASNVQNVTPDILIAFKSWLKSHKEYVNLRFQYGDTLFMRTDGEFIIQAVRIAYEAFTYGIHSGRISISAGN